MKLVVLWVDALAMWFVDTIGSTVPGGCLSATVRSSASAEAPLRSANVHRRASRPLLHVAALALTIAPV